MKLKRIASLTAFVSLFFILLTSAVLYIVPQGRVAYWANWQLWGLSKEQWSAIHINVGILFIISLLLHTSYNWDSIELYLKDKNRNMKVFTKNFNVALLLVVFCVVGTYVGIPPFSTIIALNSQIKEAAAQKYGEPPYGHAELSSLKSFANHVGINLSVGMQALHEAGYAVESEAQSLKQIAIVNGVSPQQIYLVMIQSSAVPGETKMLPKKPGQGLGKLTLLELCSKYDLDINGVITSLEKANISARKEMTIKQIAELNGLRPMGVYGHIREIVQNDDMM